MTVDRIDGLASLDKVRARWNAIYAADNQATIFVSHAWLRSWASVAEFPFILAFRPTTTGQYVAFLALQMHAVRSRGFVVDRELRLGGSPFADYPGMVCMPGFEDQAISAYSQFLKRHLAWDTFVLNDIRDPRCVRLVDSFASEEFDVEPSGQIACPFIELPSDWEQYLIGQVGSRSRRALRRRMREVEALPKLRVVDVSADNLKSQIETVIALNQARWGRDNRAKTFEAIYRGCFDAHCLWIRTLWDGEVPIAAVSGFVDEARSTFYSYSSGFNPAYAPISPGLVVMAYSIKYAVENGLRVYDFLRGGEEYKYSFGARDRFSKHWLIRRRSMRRILITGARRILSGARRLTSRFAISSEQAGRVDVETP